MNIAHVPPLPKPPGDMIVRIERDHIIHVTMLQLELKSNESYKPNEYAGTNSDEQSRLARRPTTCPIKMDRYLAAGRSSLVGCPSTVVSEA